MDILPVLAKPLDGGIISKWLIEEAQASLEKGIGSENGLYSLKGKVSIIMKGAGTLNCEAKIRQDTHTHESILWHGIDLFKNTVSNRGQKGVPASRTFCVLRILTTNNRLSSP